MGMSKTDWVFIGSGYYLFIFLMLSMIPIGTTTTDDSFGGEEDDKFRLQFKWITNISEIPLWANVMLFGPLGSALLYLGLTTIFGVIFDGGS